MAFSSHVYTCARSTDVDVLDRDLRRSPAIARGKIGLTVLWNRPSASEAYADEIEAASAETLIFAHCDVYFPEGWFERLEWEMARLTLLDPDWAVAAVIGVTTASEFIGRAWDSSLAPLFAKTGGMFGNALAAPARIASCDEMVIIIRNATGVRFDRKLPGFHLYGTDIVLEAERLGRTAYALDMPLIHNAKAQLNLGPDYVEAYQYMVRKWQPRLPVPTTCGVLTANPLVLPFRRLKIRYKALCRPSTYSTERLSDPAVKAEELGMYRMLATPVESAESAAPSTAAQAPSEAAMSALPHSAGVLPEPPRPDAPKAVEAHATTSLVGAGGRYRVRALHSRAEIEPLRAFWNACDPGRDCDLDFYLFVSEHIDSCLRPHVLVLLEGETPRALLAGRIDIVKTPVKAGYFTVPVPALKILRIVHGGILGELDGERASLLVSSIIATLDDGTADAAMLESAEIDSPLVECARAAPSWLCSDRLLQPTVHRMRDMSGAAGSFQSQLSSHARYQQRQRVAKFKRTFDDVRIERFHSPDDLPELLAAAESIANKSYQRGLGVGFSRTPFVEARLEFEAQKGWIRGFVLYFDNSPRAFWIGSLHNNVFVSNYLAFDPSYSDYSPGMYLLLIAMDEIWADEPALQRFDFGIGDAFYKERLSNRCVEETPVYIFAPRLKPVAVNILRSTVGGVSRSIQRSEKLAPYLKKMKRWLRRRAVERA
ncbi:hypothetical protein BOSEA31B_13403 [Hyphomicrobiales bacterium]|nr:hypothetical protein BOSEA31B_13403 [Hyphomicrobiales bacterium]CAH1699174.1 hypothetical protein BOSEA1005_12227 [Hyphomicrobiales bacterium]CAI0342960.1 hypothetical protein BO1005MUT1_210025 [Hyphomicrobiales bacterium]